MLNLIVATANNNVIGLGGKMPWHLPAELAYFKQVTMGHPIIMGRKTFESISRPLPSRRNIVVTGNAAWHHDGVEVATSVAAALALVTDQTAFVIGGATLYETALPLADRIYLTAIHADVDGDTFFPPLPATEWQETSRKPRPKDEKNTYDVDFIVFDRLVR
ncbi:MAG: dihydrofolate reductase [Rhodocyclaceae bacterium]|nr:dihydrofolate reductase [Rhodocyclaceae bacterium]